MFELFLPLLRNNKIEQWTANEIWKHLKLTSEERNRKNRQRMYRLLRELVAEGYLTKKTNLNNPCLSTFSITNQSSKLHKYGYLSLDNIQMIDSQKK